MPSSFSSSSSLPADPPLLCACPFCSTTGGAVENSWETWWRDENSYAMSLNPWAKAAMVLKTLPYVMVGCGLLYRPLLLESKADEFAYALTRLAELLLLTLLYQGVDLAAPWLRRRYSDARVILRMLKMGILLLGATLAIVVVVAHPESLRYILALAYFTATLSTLLLVLGVAKVSMLHFVHDVIVSHFIFLPLFLFSALQVHYSTHPTRILDPLMLPLKNGNRLCGMEEKPD